MSFDVTAKQDGVIDGASSREALQPWPRSGARDDSAPTSGLSFMATKTRQCGHLPSVATSARTHPGDAAVVKAV